MPNTLTLVERQILANQFRILAEIEENGERHTIAAEIIENGYTGQYHYAFNVDKEEVSFEICVPTGRQPFAKLLATTEKPVVVLKSAASMTVPLLVVIERPLTDC